MSFNPCETYLLELRKDEIWRLLYFQRRSEKEAYEKLVQKGLGWLGEQRFQDVITKWECDEPDVWPARPDCWRSHRSRDDQISCDFRPGQACAKLQGEASGSLSRSPGGCQSHYWMKSLSSPHSPEHGTIMRMSQSAGEAVSPGESSLVLEEACTINPKPSSGPILDCKSPDGYQKQGLAERPGSDDDRPRNRTNNWPLNTPSPDMSSSSLAARDENDSSPTTTTTTAASSLCYSQAWYDDSSVSMVCVDCGEDHPCHSASLYDPSCGYTYAHPKYDEALAMVLGPFTDIGCVRVSESAAQRPGKNVSHVFGYIVHPAEDEGDAGSEGEDEHPNERENSWYQKGPNT